MDVSKTTVTLPCELILPEPCVCKGSRADNDVKAVRMLEKASPSAVRSWGTQVCTWGGTGNRGKSETGDACHRRKDYWKKRYAEERAQQGS